MSTRRQSVVALLAAPLLPLSLSRAEAEESLPKNVNLIIGFPPGGAIDTIARIVAQRLNQTLGTAVVVQNRPGAGGNIAQQQVFRSEPDGTNLLLANIGSLVINPRLMQLNYDPRELSAVSLATTFPNFLVVKSDLGVRTLAEYIALAKSDPKRVSFASGGAGTSSHLAGELFNERTGLEILHVPFQGGGPALTAVLGGQVTSYYATPASARPFLEAQQIVALASTGPERMPEYPNVPTIAESGFSGFDAVDWYAFVLAPKTPLALVKQWNAQLVTVLSAPEVISAFANHGLTPKPSTPQELTRFMDGESAKWTKVIADRNIKLG